MAVYENSFENFGSREVALAGELLTAFSAGKLTPIADAYFDQSGVKVAFNDSSGYVFITNDDYQVIMDDGDGRLDLFIVTGWSGQEDFLDNHIENIENYPEDYELDDLEDIKGYEEYLNADQKKILENAISEKGN
tara:strand:- start:922 stop:1326 length:405 start_codon:yes stop_codon:yes gene_type:complete